MSGGGVTQAVIFILFLNFGPYNIYYSTLYTEPCFMLLICLALYCMYERHWIAMGIFGALAGLTRNTGIFLVFVIPFYCLQEYGKETEKKSVKGFFRWLLVRPFLILGTFLIPLGFFLYMRYLTYLLGDGLAFMHVQYGWGKDTGNPLKRLWYAFFELGTPNFLFAVFTFLMICLCIRQCFRRRPEAVLSLIFLLVPLSTTVYGMTRYTLCSFPFLLEISSALKDASRGRRLAWGTFLFLMGLVTAANWFESANIMI